MIGRTSQKNNRRTPKVVAGLIIALIPLAVYADLPVTLQNGTLADANDMMENFNALDGRIADYEGSIHVDEDGNIGIGTTSPMGTLDVSTSGNILIGGNLSLSDASRDLLMGDSNSISGFDRSAILSGFNNTLSNNDSWDTRTVIAGGVGNSIVTSGRFSNVGRNAIVGGDGNSIDIVYAAQNDGNSFIGGGKSNSITASYATIPGGRSNTVSGDYGFAAGRRAKAIAQGAFALADSADEDFVVESPDVFGGRFNGGYWLLGGNVGIGTTDPGAELEVAGDIKLTDDSHILYLGSEPFVNGIGNCNALFGGAGNTSVTGQWNTLLGNQAGSQITSGSANVLIGQACLAKVGEGSYNVAVGNGIMWLANGSQNTALGYYAGHSNTTGSGNVFIGYQAGYNEAGSNKLYIENSNSAYPLIYGEFDNDILTINGDVGIGVTNPEYALDVVGTVHADAFTDTSDIRLKTDIAPLDDALEGVQCLDAVRYRWADPDKPQDLQIGLVAQEVERCFPEVVSTDERGYKSVAYARLVAPLAQSVKEQQRVIEGLARKEVEQRQMIADQKKVNLEQQKEIVRLKKEVARMPNLETRLTRLEALLNSGQ